MKNLEPHIMTFDEKRGLFEHYQQSRKRLLLFDYDGTLVPFRRIPEEAQPDNRLKELLTELSSQPENEVILISGRDAFTLDSWFPDPGISLVAEHGALFRYSNRGWSKFLNKQPEWMNSVQLIFEKHKLFYTGSILEIKSYSIAFHYRQITDIEIINELKQKIVEDLMILKHKFDFSIVNGSMVIEVKNKNVSKGLFVENILADNNFDFTLAIGDDTTDEDMFDALYSYNNSYTIKVGIAQTNAKLNLVSASNIISLLEQLSNFRGLHFLNSKN